MQLIFFISKNVLIFFQVWDYQNKTCVHTLDGHAQNISSGEFFIFKSELEKKKKFVFFFQEIFLRPAEI